MWSLNDLSTPNPYWTLLKTHFWPRNNGTFKKSIMCRPEDSFHALSRLLIFKPTFFEIPEFPYLLFPKWTAQWMLTFLYVLLPGKIINLVFSFGSFVLIFNNSLCKKKKKNDISQQMEKFFWMLGKDSFSNSFWNYSKNKFSQLENNEKSDKDILFVCKGW